MNFREALEQLMAGMKIRRKEWPESSYIAKNENGVIVSFRPDFFIFTYDLSILESYDWLIPDETGNELRTFPDVMDALQRGKKAKLAEWVDDKEAYIFAENNDLTMVKIRETNFTPTYKCLCAADWEAF